MVKREVLTENICCNCRYYDGVKGVMGCAPCSFGEEKKMVLWNNQSDAIWLIPERFKTGTPTNADRIREMSDEEIANLFDNTCIETMGEVRCGLYKSCYDCWLAWMKEEVSE